VGFCATDCHVVPPIATSFAHAARTTRDAPPLAARMARGRQAPGVALTAEDRAAIVLTARLFQAENDALNVA
jgi:hypothetical protein